MRMNTKASVICDDCHFQYDTSKMKRHHVYLKDEEKTEIRFWSCPYCGKRYLIGVYNTEIRKMIRNQDKRPNIEGKQLLLTQRHKKDVDKILEVKNEVHRR